MSRKFGGLPLPDGKRELVKRFQSADDITKQMRRAEYNSRTTSKKLSEYFKADDKMKTCKRVWVFLRQNVQYNREPAHDQTAKTISRYLVDGYGDCKHYATTIVGILNACKIPAWFVLISQKKSKVPNHAYAAAYVNGQIVIIDPCKDRFGSEATYTRKFHIPPVKSSDYGFKLSERR